MQGQTDITVSTQTQCAIDNMTSGTYISLSPSLYAKVQYPGQEATYNVIHGIGANSAGGSFYTHVLTNNYGMEAGYNTESLSLSMKSDTVDYTFMLTRVGKEMTYRSLANGSIDVTNVLYEDIVGQVYLRARAATPEVGGEIRTVPVEKDGVYSMIDVGNYAKGLPVTESSRARSKTIPDTEMFSLLQNVDLYVFGSLFQLNGGNLVRVDRQIMKGMAAWGGFFALTGDINKLYPDGITELIINDGFSDGLATIEFNHDVERKTVTITIKSHTSKVCDIRDLTEVGFGFPNTICFAL